MNKLPKVFTAAQIKSAANELDAEYMRGYNRCLEDIHDINGKSEVIPAGYGNNNALIIEGKKFMTAQEWYDRFFEEFGDGSLANGEAVFDRMVKAAKKLKEDINQPIIARPENLGTSKAVFNKLMDMPGVDDRRDDSGKYE